MNMIERVARAICRLVPIDGCSQWNEPYGYDFDKDYSDREQEIIRCIVRATIEAMREPTDRMLGAFDRLTDDNGTVLVKTGYRAMIDEALRDE